MKFKVDVFAWIPQPEVPNPLHALPGGASTWGPGACGPCFGGDAMILPPAAPANWTSTFRARQSFAFTVAAFGAAPVVTANGGVEPGTTTVLTAKRSAGGQVCHRLKAAVKASEAAVAWHADKQWYELLLHGAAQDPVPAAAAGKLGPVAGYLASAATPNLEWTARLRFAAAGTAAQAKAATYAVSKSTLDVSAKSFAGPLEFGKTGHLLHGLVKLRRFPSYIVYVTIEGPADGPVSIPVYFADASGRALTEIVSSETDPIRQLPF